MDAAAAAPAWMAGSQLAWNLADNTHFLRNNAAHALAGDQQQQQVLDDDERLALLNSFVAMGAAALYADVAATASYAGGGFGAVPASGEAIAGLPETGVGEARERECAVCLQAFDAGVRLRRMPCSHCFHEGCIFDWLRVSCACPLCRHRLPTDSVQS